MASLARRLFSRGRLVALVVLLLALWVALVYVLPLSELCTPPNDCGSQDRTHADLAPALPDADAARGSLSTGPAPPAGFVAAAPPAALRARRLVPSAPTTVANRCISRTAPDDDDASCQRYTLPVNREVHTWIVSAVLVNKHDGPAVAIVFSTPLWRFPERTYANTSARFVQPRMNATVAGTLEAVHNVTGDSRHVADIFATAEELNWERLRETGCDHGSFAVLAKFPWRALDSLGRGDWLSAASVRLSVAISAAVVLELQHRPDAVRPGAPASAQAGEPPDLAPAYEHNGDPSSHDTALEHGGDRSRHNVTLLHTAHFEAVAVEFPIGLATLGAYAEVVADCQRALRPEPAFELGICYGPVYNFGSSMAHFSRYLLEFVAYHVGVGARHLVLYVTEAPDEPATSLIRQVEARSEVTVVLADALDASVHAYYHNQRSLIADCVNRMSGRAKFVFVADIDEWLWVDPKASLPGALEALWRRRPSPDVSMFAFTVDEDHVQVPGVCERQNPADTLDLAARRVVGRPTLLSRYPYFVANHLPYGAGKDSGGRIKTISLTALVATASAHYGVGGRVAASVGALSNHTLRKLHTRALPFAPAQYQSACSEWEDDWLRAPFVLRGEALAHIHKVKLDAVRDLALPP